MNRRTFLSAVTGSLLAAPLASEAQQAGRVNRIAIIDPAVPVTRMVESSYGHFYTWFFSEARKLSYVEGENLLVVRRSAEGHPTRFPELAREVVGLRPDVIVAISTLIAHAVKGETTTVPVVAYTSDPIAFGLVSNLARPGGNITGFSFSTGDDNLGKYLEQLRELLPGVSRVAFLAPRAVWEGQHRFSALRKAASGLRLTLVGAPLGQPIQESEYRRVFALIARDRVDALIVNDASENLTHGRLIVELAAQTRLPAIYPYRAQVEAGGLIGYAVELEDIVRRSVGYIDRILRGASPGALPYQLPTKFELVINLKTAKALGLTIPPSLLQRADQVIE